MTGVALDHVSSLLKYYLGKTRDKSTFSEIEKRPIDVWEEGVLTSDVSLTPKNIYFLQLIICCCCWFELSMSSLNTIEL